jgi:catecholate siderophore receptor
MKRNKRRSMTRTWVAMGTIAAYAAAGSSKATVAFARNAKGQAGNQAQLQVRRFDIPAGPLDLVLAQFSKTCGVTVSYTVPAETIPGFKSHGVTGLYSQAQALRAILADTGLDFTISTQDAITVGVKNSESINVTASAIDSIGLSKFPAPLIDTPQSVNAIPASLLADQGVSTLRDTLRNSPGISLAAGEGALQGDNLTIRGFSAQDDIFLDGVRDFGSYYRDPFIYERVDVLEGPAGVEFGRGSTGGVINQETKTPLLHPLMRFDGGLGTDITRRFTGDINEPLPGIGHGAAARLNFMVHDQGVAQRDVTRNRRFGVMPSFALGLNSSTRLFASELHSQEDDIPDYGIPWYFGHGAPVPRHNYYGFDHNNYFRTNVDIATVRVEHDLGTFGLLRNSARYAHFERKWQITEPQVNNASAGLITPTTPLDQVMVNRNQLTGNSDEAQMWDQAELTLTGKFLGVRQTALIGAEGGRESSDPKRFRYTNPAGINTVPLASLLHPDSDVPFSGTLYPNTNVHSTAFSAAAYALDTFQLGRKWDLSGGIRVDHFDDNYHAITNTFSAATGADTVTTPHFEQDLNKGTWRTALVYKPKENGSIYFDYGTSFNPSAETLALSAANANVPPEENQTYELGSKWQVNNGKLTARGALFRTNRENVLEPDPTNSAVDVLAGNQRVDGAEGVIQGRVTDRWELLTSYTFMHSEVVSSDYYKYSIGQPLQNVPENLFNLWSEYRLPRGFEVGAGGNFVGARLANSTTLSSPTTIIEKAPQYWTFNAMAKYDISDRIALQANINNILDRNYLDALHPSHVIPGAGTSTLFGMKFKF